MYNYSNIVFTSDMEDTLDNYSRYRYGRGLFRAPLIPVAITVSPHGFIYFPSNELIEDSNPKHISLCNHGSPRLHTYSGATRGNTYRDMRDVFFRYRINPLSIMHAFVTLNTGRLYEGETFVSFIPYGCPQAASRYINENNTIEYRTGFTEREEHFVAMLTLGFPVPCPELVVIRTEDDLEDYYNLEAYLELQDVIRT